MADVYHFSCQVNYKKVLDSRAHDRFISKDKAHKTFMSHEPTD